MILSWSSRSALLLVALAAMSVADAQTRAGSSVYVSLRGSAVGYTGDLDRNPDNSALDLTDGFADLGFGVGGELGYQFSPALSFGLGVMYQETPALNDGFPFGGGARVAGGEAYQFQGLFRWLPAPAWRVSPFVELGGAAVLGALPGAVRAGDVQPDEDKWGYGPVLGLGLDVALTPQFSLFLGAQSTVVFPDIALDGTEPGSGGPADDDGFDTLTNLGGGLRFVFGSTARAPEIVGLDCPAELQLGDTGTFQALTEEARADVTWDWGDGTTSSGSLTTHTFSGPGTYTVTATALDSGGSDSDSCLVTVMARGEAPYLSGCQATPVTAGVGELVTIDAEVEDADDILVDFGDGDNAETLPARHAYTASGTYRVTIRTANDYGEDRCTVTVTVGDAFCESVSELSTAFFDYGATSLTVDAAARLDETIEILRRCPSLCVTINGYSDGEEPGGALRVSQARADAVRAYYEAQGIDPARLRAVGQGVDPQADPKEDPGPGARQSRRVDSIPTSCAGF